jgi:dephospho-CoA kinase
MKQKKRVVIGLTGQFASGKTTAAEFFRQCGARIINADRVVDDIYKTQAPLVRRISAVFGADVLKPDGSLDKNALSKKVFADRKAVRHINALVHPAVKKIIRQKIKKNIGVIVVDAPLLIESSFHREVDYVVLVRSSLKLQMERALKNLCLSEAQIRKRLKHQLPFRNKKRFADFIINNRSTLSRLKGQVARIYKEVK